MILLVSFFKLTVLAFCFIQRDSYILSYYNNVNKQPKRFVIKFNNLYCVFNHRRNENPTTDKKF